MAYGIGKLPGQVVRPTSCPNSRPPHTWGFATRSRGFGRLCRTATEMDWAPVKVMYDARAILKRVSVLKQRRLRTGTAAHAAHASEWAGPALSHPSLLSLLVGP